MFSSRNVMTVLQIFIYLYILHSFLFLMYQCIAAAKHV